MNGCKYCSRKPEFEAWGDFFDHDNEEQITPDGWTVLYIGVDRNGRLRITASGDDRADYYPKYCPECGRPLWGQEVNDDETHL